MKANDDKAPAGKPKPAVKPTKVQEYVKKTFKNNWSNTKSVYTRPR
ncbi:MAG: hypothetical protein QM762_10270 [Chryseolinea sp.]